MTEGKRKPTLQPSVVGLTGQKGGCMEAWQCSFCGPGRGGECLLSRHPFLIAARMIERNKGRGPVTGSLRGSHRASDLHPQLRVRAGVSADPPAVYSLGL